MNITKRTAKKVIEMIEEHKKMNELRYYRSGLLDEAEYIKWDDNFNEMLKIAESYC